MDIIKASGEKEKFNPEKIYLTMVDSGATKNVADEVIKKIKSEYGGKAGIQTQEILNKVLELLQKRMPEVAARYDLKRAIMSLGPSGFPFEVYFASILENYGYKVKVGQIIHGKKVNHEVDIEAKNKSSYMVECKYHNKLGIHTKLKVAMYTYARFLDLKDKFNFPWLATNTKCTPEAVNYSKGVGLKITSWQYPPKENLKELIEKKGLYPITMVRSVDDNAKEQLYKAKIMLLKDLKKHNLKELQTKTGLSTQILQKILEEANKICVFKKCKI